MQEQDWMSNELLDLNAIIDEDVSYLMGPLAESDDFTNNGSSDVTSSRAVSSMSTSNSMPPSVENENLPYSPTPLVNESSMPCHSSDLYISNSLLSIPSPFGSGDSDCRNISMLTTYRNFHNNTRDWLDNDSVLLRTDNETVNVTKGEGISESNSTFHNYPHAVHQVEGQADDEAGIFSSDDEVPSPKTFMYYDEDTDELQEDEEVDEERLSFGSESCSSMQGYGSYKNMDSKRYRADFTVQEKRMDEENTPTGNELITNVSAAQEILKHLAPLCLLRKRKADEEENETLSQADVAILNSVDSSTATLNNKIPRLEQKAKKKVGKRRRGISESYSSGSQENNTARLPTSQQQPVCSGDVLGFPEDLADLLVSPSFLNDQSVSKQETRIHQGRARHTSLPDRMATTGTTTTTTRVQPNPEVVHTSPGDPLSASLHYASFPLADYNGNWVHPDQTNQQAASVLQNSQVCDKDHVQTRGSHENNCQNLILAKLASDFKEDETRDVSTVSTFDSKFLILCNNNVRDTETSTQNHQTSPPALEDIALSVGSSALNQPVMMHTNSLNITHPSFSQNQTYCVSHPQSVHAGSVHDQGALAFNQNSVHSLPNHNTTKLNIAPCSSGTSAPESPNLNSINIKVLCSGEPASGGFSNRHTVVGSNAQVSESRSQENGTKSQPFQQHTISELTYERFTQEPQSALTETKTIFEQPSGSNGTVILSEENLQRAPYANLDDDDWNRILRLQTVAQLQAAQPVNSDSEQFRVEIDAESTLPGQNQRSDGGIEIATEQKLGSLSKTTESGIQLGAEPLVHNHLLNLPVGMTTTTTSAMMNCTKSQIILIPKKTENLVEASTESKRCKTDVHEEENIEMCSKDADVGLTPSEPIHPPTMAAAQQVLKTGKMTPIIKEELKWVILSRRHAEGKEDLDVTFTPPPKTQMTEEEASKSKERKERNRLAAAKSRKKKKAKKEANETECETLAARNADLRKTIKKMEEEKTSLLTSLYGLGIITAFRNSEG